MEITFFQPNLIAPTLDYQRESPAGAIEARHLIQAVRKLNATEFAGPDRELVFSFDRETRRPLVKIVNRETREVVTQLPPEYILRLAEEQADL